MIQRKQSLFLALAAVCVGLMFLFPIASYTMASADDGSTGSLVFGALGVTMNGQTPLFAPDPIVPIYAVAAVAVAILLFIIFLYKQRARQLRFSNFAYMLLLGLFAAVFMAEHSLGSLMEAKGGSQGSYGVSYFLPLVALVFVFLAVRAIKADEALVKSADRLR